MQFMQQVMQHEMQQQQQHQQQQQPDRQGMAFFNQQQQQQRQQRFPQQNSQHLTIPRNRSKNEGSQKSTAGMPQQGSEFHEGRHPATLCHVEAS